MARVSIEDCLHKMPNRFALVSVAAHRTRQLMEGSEALIKTKNKLGVTALREIAEGLIVSSESLDTLQKEARAEAIQTRDHFDTGMIGGTFPGSEDGPAHVPTEDPSAAEQEAAAEAIAAAAGSASESEGEDSGDEEEETED